MILLSFLLTDCKQIINPYVSENPTENPTGSESESPLPPINCRDLVPYCTSCRLDDETKCKTCVRGYKLEFNRCELICNAQNCAY